MEQNIIEDLDDDFNFDGIVMTSDSQHRFKQSSTAFLSITFIIFFIFSAFKFYKN
jgi:hypothetical protein